MIPILPGVRVWLGKDIIETLEVISPRQWKVIQTVRDKYTCRRCEGIAQLRHRSTRSCGGALRSPPFNLIYLMLSVNVPLRWKLSFP